MDELDFEEGEVDDASGQGGPHSGTATLPINPALYSASRALYVGGVPALRDNESVLFDQLMQLVASVSGLTGGVDIALEIMLDSDGEDMCARLTLPSHELAAELVEQHVVFAGGDAGETTVQLRWWISSLASTGGTSGSESSAPEGTESKGSTGSKEAKKGKQKSPAASYPTLWIGDIPPGVKNSDLRDVFARFGTVKQATLLYDDEAELRGAGGASGGAASSAGGGGEGGFDADDGAKGEPGFDVFGSGGGGGGAVAPLDVTERKDPVLVERAERSQESARFGLITMASYREADQCIR